MCKAPVNAPKWNPDSKSHGGTEEEEKDEIKDPNRPGRMVQGPGRDTHHLESHHRTHVLF